GEVVGIHVHGHAVVIHGRKHHSGSHHILVGADEFHPDLATERLQRAVFLEVFRPDRDDHGAFSRTKETVVIGNLVYLRVEARHTADQEQGSGKRPELLQVRIKALGMGRLAFKLPNSPILDKDQAVILIDMLENVAVDLPAFERGVCWAAATARSQVDPDTKLLAQHIVKLEVMFRVGIADDQVLPARMGISAQTSQTDKVGALLLVDGVEGLHGRNAGNIQPERRAMGKEDGAIDKQTRSTGQGKQTHTSLGK